MGIATVALIDNTVKVTMGFLEIAFALKFLANTDIALHPGEPILFNFETVLIASCYSGARFTAGKTHSHLEVHTLSTLLADRAVGGENETTTLFLHPFPLGTSRDIRAT